MQGLLDFVKTPEGQGLLSAVAGGLAGARRGTPLNNVGRGLLTGLQGYGNAQQLQQQEAESALNRQVRDLQIKSAQQQMQEREQQRQAFEGFNPQMMATQGALAGGGGPTMANASKMTPVDPMKQQLFELAKAGGMSFNDFFKMTGPKETKVKSYEQVRNADGSVSIVGLTEDGRVVNTSQAPFIKPEVRDFGGSIGGIDPVTGKVTTYGKKSMSPDAQASNAVAWANVGVARDRLKFDKDNGTAGRAPAGYRWAGDGTKLEAIPGGPADKGSTATEGERKAATLLTRLEGSLSQLQGTLKDNPGAAKPSVFAEMARRAPLGGGDTTANVFTPEARQRVEAAQLDILDAALTLGTGAAYTREQLEGYRRSYFPQIGDGPATVKEKQDRLANVIEAARIAAGRAAPAPRQVAPATPQAGSDPLKGFRILEVN